MLNLPGNDDHEAPRGSTNHSNERTQSPRALLRRRPLSGGDRLRGWADVRELHADPADSVGDGAHATKYHIDLNMTAHLDWEEWQRLCAAEPLQRDAPTWCMLSASGAETPSPDPANESNDGDEDLADAVHTNDAGEEQPQQQQQRRRNRPQHFVRTQPAPGTS